MSKDYPAFWIPGPNNLDMDEGLRVGYLWLDRTSPTGSRVVVLPAIKMLRNRPMLGRANEYTVISPHSRGIDYGEAAAVLAIWPSPTTLEFAEELAVRAPLCVIPYNHDIGWWIAKTGATNVIEPSSPPTILPRLDPAVIRTLDSILSFGGGNGFCGGGDKEDAVRELRAMVATGHRPSSDELENYLRASGETDVGGARRARHLYEAILAGRVLHDYSGRSI